MNLRFTQFRLATDPGVRGLLEMSVIAYARNTLLSEDAPESHRLLAVVMLGQHPGPREETLEVLAKNLAFRQDVIDLQPVQGETLALEIIPDEALDGVVEQLWAMLADSLQIPDKVQ